MAAINSAELGKEYDLTYDESKFKTNDSLIQSHRLLSRKDENSKKENFSLSEDKIGELIIVNPYFPTQVENPPDLIQALKMAI